jgi:hypothetical protein
MKLKGRHFETVSDIQKESQAVLDSIKENDFHGAFEAGKNDGIAVYVPKEMTLLTDADCRKMGHDVVSNLRRKVLLLPHALRTQPTFFHFAL